MFRCHTTVKRRSQTYRIIYRWASRLSACMPFNTRRRSATQCSIVPEHAQQATGMLFTQAISALPILKLVGYYSSMFACSLH